MPTAQSRNGRGLPASPVNAGWRARPRPYLFEAPQHNAVRQAHREGTMPPDTASGSPWDRRIVQFFLTYVAARVGGWIAGIRYDPISDAFDALKLAVDVARWLFCWTAVGAVLGRVGRRTQPAGS